MCSHKSTLAKYNTVKRNKDLFLFAQIKSWCIWGQETGGGLDSTMVKYSRHENLEIQETPGLLRADICSVLHCISHLVYHSPLTIMTETNMGVICKSKTKNEVCIPLAWFVHSPESDTIQSQTQSLSNPESASCSDRVQLRSIALSVQPQVLPGPIITSWKCESF